MASSLYLPIDSSAAQFRLLVVHPGPLTRQVSCTLRNAVLPPCKHRQGWKWKVEYDELEKARFWTSTYSTELDSGDTVCYEALSYVWGTNTPEVSIFINGKEFGVTSNLAAALKRLRRSDRDRVIWIDAICINQLDIRERSEQVSIMASIYKHADRVCVWMGESSPTSDLAIRLLGRLGGIDKQLSDVDLSRKGVYEQLSAGPHYSSFPGGWPYEESINVQSVSVSLTAPLNYESRPEYQKVMFEAYEPLVQQFGLITKEEDISPDGWEALNEFMTKRPWWNRIWITQEVANARECKIYCGPTATLWWNTLHDIYRNKFASFNFRLVNILAAGFAKIDFTRSSTRNPMRACQLEPKDSTFLHLLVRYRMCQSSDPRDKVYALLGLPIASRGLDIRVDYAKSVCRVYCEAAKAVMESDQNLDLLCLVHSSITRSTVTKRNIHGLPSWCPDWSEPPQIGLVPLISVEASRRFYEAAGPWHSSWAIDAPNTEGQLRGGWISSPSEGGSLPNVRRTTSFLGKISDRKELHSVHSDKGFLIPAAESFHLLRLTAVIWDQITFLGAPVTEESWRESTWEDIARGWFDERNSSEAYPWWTETCGMAHMYALIRDELPFARSEANRLNFHDTASNLEKAFLEWQYRSTRIHQHSIDSPLFEQIIRNKLVGWRYCKTKTGAIGLVPHATRLGDVIAVILGCTVPLILRMQDACSKKHLEFEAEHVTLFSFQLVASGLKGKRKSVKSLEYLEPGPDVPVFEQIGTGYIHGIMHGMIKDGLDAQLVKTREILLR